MLPPAPRGDESSEPFPALDTVLFRSSLVTVGAFRAAPEHPRFRDSGPIENHVFVFPRRSVWIQHAEEKAFVADPNVITFYNRGQTYRRGKISEEGDRCEWFALAPEAIVEAVSGFTAGTVERPDRPFAFSHARSDSSLYLAQRLLVAEIRTAMEPDILRVEESCLALLDAALACAFAPSRPRFGAGSAGGDRDVALRAASLLAERFRETHRLTDIAVRLSVSASHLCRVFRRHLGTTLHRYRDQLRLRTALEDIARGRDLTDLALELGYSSHSHFTAAFRRTFHQVPSEIRRRLPSEAEDGGRARPRPGATAACRSVL